MMEKLDREGIEEVFDPQIVPEKGRSFHLISKIKKNLLSNNSPLEVEMC